MFKDQLVDIAGRAKQSHTPERRFALFSKKRLLPPLNSTVLGHGGLGPLLLCRVGGRGIERGMAAAANYCDQPPLGEQIAPQTALGAEACHGPPLESVHPAGATTLENQLPAVPLSRRPRPLVVSSAA